MRRLAMSALVAGLGLAGPAWAHAILVDSNPAPNGHVAPGHVAILLRYNSRIDPGRSRITLLGPGDTTQILLPAPNSPAGVIDTAAELKPGAYVLKWQVLATDGHITRGRVPFTVGTAR